MRRTPLGGRGTGWITQAELLNLQKNGQFPDDPVKINGIQIHYVSVRRTSNNSHKGDNVRGTITVIIVSVD